MLGRRALGRATLARQLLLERVARPVPDALEHVVGLQGQEPRIPHLSLWNRLAGYDPASLDALMTGRAVVRTPLMRTTIHTVTTADARALRPLLQPVLDRVLAGTAWGQRLRGQDLDDVVAEARDLLAGRPMGRAALARELAGRHPGLDAESVAFAVSYRVPWVQPPPRGLWSGTGAAVMVPLDSWVPADPADLPVPMTAEELVRRYLAAFDPATVRDVQAWCGLTRLREVTDRLGDRLRRLRGEDGAELLDVPDAPLPDPDIPAPVRFLAEYDNVTLSHADRSRVVVEGDHRPLRRGAGGWVGSVLVDGLVSATWAARPGGPAMVLTVRPSRPLTPAERADVEAEGRVLLAFLAPERAADVRFEAG
ncbi:winged helix DNA-binding domain-containing protein [Geodermatophilus sp. YIM 151500]|uniref:winged helix DNA-binding domain-containing protein n=1 Tax=Geodermatophilus sp. YIM 151500 TaxID=2984531 RepID=UPI0021E50A67|nr:winged helix DNA-binding domain-containing protein [Geodermatophilus sp. YIM 151500]MCV2488028.1 winged helix DNA-binding domain-containing protein [Geodermatophilus sp. YIM 151500]